jgi:nucleotide-binding universal stress UspA family protein
MIKKIICPIDFSDAANNALEYAAKLALVFNAELLLVNVERIIPAADAVSLGVGIGANARGNALIAAGRLKEMSAEANRSFKISVNYEVEITIKSLAKMLTSFGKKNTMIVMGTNGADNLSQFFFGTNTYNVIKKAECPVLLVPENYSYRAFKNILYAFTYEEKGKLALTQFYEFSKAFDAKIIFLHVSKEDTEISRDVFSAVKEEVEEFFDGQGSLDFKRVFSKEAEGAIDDFVRENSIDLLVMAARHRNVIESVFRKRPLLDGLSLTGMYPILVFHS